MKEQELKIPYQPPELKEVPELTGVRIVNAEGGIPSDAPFDDPFSNYYE